MTPATSAAIAIFDMSILLLGDRRAWPSALVRAVEKE
jgi:hypothetical protein